ncbi:hypothetical protein V2H21_03985 [Riemerella anatipestifer]|uniref:hypothetical protein n=1 Tax=Riemerella anatipestifer TaxID=34085 RepID=UPI002EA39ACD|nr:hypothetical protein [Riemerella anatipestifer]
MKKYILYSFIVLFLSSCNKEKVMAEKGGIDIISNIYFNASKGLDSVKSYHISSINFDKNRIIEIVPDMEYPEIYSQIFFIKDSLCYPLGEFEEAKKISISEKLKNGKPFNVYEKEMGAVFDNGHILNFHIRKVLKDTTIFNKEYKRFEIKSPKSYTRYYVLKNDTILPYALYRKNEKEMGGRLERIDSYDKKNDIFVTMQLIPRKEWDIQAKEIFEYDQFVNSKNQKK